VSENEELYNRCKLCGQILTDIEIEDNEELCDFCYTQGRGYAEYIGEDN
jgi:hypothetical protein